MCQLKPLDRQVLVVTGASSGIGLATARLAAERGAKVVLASRNAAPLDEIVDGIKRRGGEATAVITDVADPAQVEHLAAKAVEAYGGFDTWVNDAGLSIFGWLTEIDDADHRRLFDANFLGLVYGSKAAAKHLRDKGGAIINLGSVVSDMAVPSQGVVCASKYAIKGFTDALRLELAEMKAPISVTLIKPATNHTPFPAHAMNRLEEEPKLPPPAYHHEVVAEAILHAAQHGGRDYDVGGGGKPISSVNKRFPSAVDQVTSSPAAEAQQTTGTSAETHNGALYGPGHDGSVRGASPHWVRRSLSTKARLHPAVTAGLFTVAALAGAAFITQRDE